MNTTISLIESKTFWSALLAFVAVITKAFGLSQLTAWLIDPSVLDAIMNVIAMLGAIGAIVFRAKATAKVTNVLPPGKK